MQRLGKWNQLSCSSGKIPNLGACVAVAWLGGRDGFEDPPRG